MEEETKSKGSIGLRIVGYILVFLTVIMSLVALQNILAIANSSSTDGARNLGGIIGTLIFPVVFGLLASYCLRKGKGQ